MHKLVDRRSIDKISVLDDNTWMVFSGLAGDGRMVTEATRRFCIDYKTQFGCSPSALAITKVIAKLQHRATLSADGRPLGINVAVFGYDHLGTPKMFVTRASGHVTQWRAFAIGKGANKAISKMGDEFSEKRSTKESLKRLLSVLGKPFARSNLLKSEEGLISNYIDKGNEGGEEEWSELSNKQFDVYVIRKKVDNDDDRATNTNRNTMEALFASGIETVDDIPMSWNLH